MRMDGPSRSKSRPRSRDAADDRLGQVGIVKHSAQSWRGLLVVKIIGRLRKWRSLTTWKRTLAASGP